MPDRPAKEPESMCAARWLLLLFPLLWITCGAGRTALAEDFRIHSRVHVGDMEASSETLTLFRAGRVYDFLSAPRETTVFDPDNRFILLDPDRRLQTEVSAEQVTRRVARLRSEAQTHRQPALNFLANPRFTETYDETSEEISLESPWLTYRAKIEQAPSRDAARQYGEFADWYTQLNALLNPSGLLPFSRMELNRALVRRQAVPREVLLTFSPKKPDGDRITLRSVHQVQWSLSRADLERIDEVHRQLHSFQKVTPQEYHQPAGEPIDAGE